MFDPERLLGQMLGGALGDAFGGSQGRRRRSAFTRGRMTGAAPIGLGLLGVAIAAWEHFGQNRGAEAGRAPATLDPPGTRTTPMPPPPPGAAGAAPDRLDRTAAAAASVGSTPPPPPGAAPATRRLPLLDERQQSAVLLMRAMIAAANADGHVDGAERAAILDRARAAGLDAASLQFLEEEIARPQSLAQVVANTPPALAAETYAAAALAITVDTDSERAWLDALAEGLRLDAAVRADLDARIAG